jgi:hypothetical protein
MPSAFLIISTAFILKKRIVNKIYAMPTAFLNIRIAFQKKTVVKMATKKLQKKLRKTKTIKQIKKISAFQNFQTMPFLHKPNTK